MGLAQNRGEPILPEQQSLEKGLRRERRCKKRLGHTNRVWDFKLCPPNSETLPRDLSLWAPLVRLSLVVCFHCDTPAPGPVPGNHGETNDDQLGGGPKPSREEDRTSEGCGVWRTGCHTPPSSLPPASPVQA